LHGRRGFAEERRVDELLMGADFTEVGQAFHSMPDTQFTPFRTAGSLMSDTA
jgi:hypothetical protein